MKRLLVVIGVLLVVAALAYARAPKSDYQWTGTVLEADGDHLVVPCCWWRRAKCLRPLASRRPRPAGPYSLRPAQSL